MVLFRLIWMQRCVFSGFYVMLKYLVTPFKKIDGAVPSKARILDIGCGNGMYSVYLKLKSYDRSILGVDSDERRIRYANTVVAGIKGVDFSVVDLEKGYTISKYDCYLINDVLHHIDDKSKSRLLKKIYDKMGKKAVLVIKDMDKHNVVKFFLNFVNDKIMTMGDTLYFMNKARMLDLLRNIGYSVKVERIDGYIFPHVLYVCRR